MSYTLNTATGIVTRDSDGAQCAPAQSVDDPLFVEYHAFLEAGGAPRVISVPQLTVSDYEQAVQQHMDTTAQTRGYDSILSAASYKGSSNPRFGPEGAAFADWRDAVWTYCYQQLAAVQGGQIQPPAIEQLIAGLPALTLP